MSYIYIYMSYLSLSLQYTYMYMYMYVCVYIYIYTRLTTRQHPYRAKTIQQKHTNYNTIKQHMQ